MKDDYTLHSGTVVEKTAEKYRVQITLNDACGHCSNQKACAIFGSDKRIIEVPRDARTPEAEVGETVNVRMHTQSGMKAVFYAYLLPVLLLMCVVIVLYAFRLGEQIVAISAVGTMVLYYIVFYFFRKRLEKKFSFTLEKTAQE